MQRVRLLKFGGSIVTSPTHADGFFREQVQRLGEELAGSAAGEPMVLVHGTGWVGKPPARELGFVASGVLGPERRREALEIRSLLHRLQASVVETLKTCGLPAEVCAVEGWFDLRTRRFVPGAAKALLRPLLAEGRVPVLVGDMLADADGAHHVISSDVMMAGLSSVLPVGQAVFLTDVDGVLHHGRLLERIGPAEARELDLEDHKQDVSGGMAAKLRCAFQTARRADACWIANGTKAGRLSGLVRGEPVPATRVCAPSGSV